MSPCTPPMKAVMSMFTMSPSWTTVESGMPWQITSLREVQSDFGKARYPSVDGYAWCAIRNSWPIRSSSSVVTPGTMCRPTSSSACAASRPATRIRSMTSADFTSEPRNGVGAFFPTYSGRAMWAGTSRQGEIVPGTSSVRTGMLASVGDAARPRHGYPDRVADTPPPPAPPAPPVPLSLGSGPAHPRRARPGTPAPRRPSPPR